jgi:hypothetical protein
MQDQYLCKHHFIKDDVVSWLGTKFTATCHVDRYECSCQVDLRTRFV